MKRLYVLLVLPLILPAFVACTRDSTLIEDLDAPEEVLAEDVDATEGAQRVRLPDAVAPLSLEAGTLVFSTGYGEAETEFGGTGDPEAVPDDGADPGPVLGPESFAVDEAGRAFVLDGLKGRVVELAADGGLVGAFALAEGVVAGDLAAGAGRVHLLTLAAEPALHSYDLGGALLAQASIDLDDPEEQVPMGVVMGPEGLPYVEMSDGEVMLPLTWEDVDDAPEAGVSYPGLPVLEDLFAFPVLLDDDLAAVRFFDPEGVLIREVLFESPGPVIADVLRAAVTGDGLVIVVFGRFAVDASGARRAAEHLVVGVDPEGRLVGTLSLPRNDGREAARSVAIAPDGGIWQLHQTTDTASLVRWSLR